MTTFTVIDPLGHIAETANDRQTALRVATYLTRETRILHTVAISATYTYQTKEND